ncbi:sine oculis-binding protein homolog isoform X1 [Drosophila bipectinata]|uniref:sine oculis-binding protein homolog isoform X1 n=2 Tax=Drosophila bipectinata TaxID=42026 RepID=UPI001C8AB2D2|nr:sine oculis-binding protein homolog isoform X1 [Drosophila bipectinata]
MMKIGSCKNPAEMSAKTSPSSSRDASVGGAANVVLPSSVQIKKELPSDEIKEFAHNTMNELLGWYGFEGVDVDRLDLTAKTSRLLQSAAAAAAANQQQQHRLHHQQQQQEQQHLERKRSSLLRSSRSALAAAYKNNNNNNGSGNSLKNNGAGGAGTGGGPNRKGGVLNCSSTTTTPSDPDTRSSREEDSKSPNSIGKPSGAGGLAHSEEKIDFNNCCWCHRPIAENAPDYLTSSDGPRYCSESCFAQSRRASFKKAKTCDWCKHVRHAVSYVDFQDGASQLQFCSEKCLNQYKMEIFCHETQAHLDMHPHLRDQALDAGSEAGLITPDLWLRNCRSRSASPASTLSVSPGPPGSAAQVANRCPDSPPSHPNPSKPLISVAPVSKLLAQKSPGPAVVPPPPPPPINRQMGSKLGRRKRQHRGLSSSSGSETVASLLQKQQQAQQQQQLQQPPTLTADFGGSSVPLPPISPMPNIPDSPQQQQAPPPLPPQPPMPRGPTAIPASYFATPSNGVPMGHPFGARPPPPPHHFLPPMPHGMIPRGFPPPFPPMLPPQIPELGALLGGVPPVTVMVPYPIIIPLPIPIPVPLPVVDFYKAHLTPEQRKRFDEERAAPSAAAEAQDAPGQQEQPQPLDCSKTRSDQEVENKEEEPAKETQEELKNDQDGEEKKSIPKTNPERNTTLASPSISPESSSSSSETHCIVQDSTPSEPEVDSQKLPKLKITRLQTKRTLIQTKEAAAECSRPLRKRKRIIDCDFQKMAIRELEATDAVGAQAHSSSNMKERDADADADGNGDGDGECNMSNNNSSAKAKK